MDLPTLSVIVPNYNHAKLLPVCLNSILSQSVAPLEVIVLDDASTDNSIEVPERYARQRAVPRSPPPHRRPSTTHAADI